MNISGELKIPGRYNEQVDRHRPQVQPEPEPEGYEFGYYTFDELSSLEISDIEATSGSITNIEIEDASDNNFQKFPIGDHVLLKLQ